MTYTFQKWDEQNHSEVKLVEDWNSLIDFVLGTDSKLSDYEASLDTPTFRLTALDEGAGTLNFRVWVNVEIDKVFGATHYFIAYKRQIDTFWQLMNVSDLEAGTTITISSPDLMENTTYEFKVQAIGALTQKSAWANVKTIKTSANTIAYPVPTNLTAIPILNGVYVKWDDLWDIGLKQAKYNVYHASVNDVTQAVKLVTTPNHYYTWMVEDKENDYINQYFWVSSVSPSGVESDKSDVVFAEPKKGIDKPITDTPTFEVTALSNGNSVYFHTWLQIVINTAESGATSDGVSRISGYIINYKKHTDVDYSRITVEQTTETTVTALTPYLEENTEYDVRICYVNDSNIEGAWSQVQTISTLTNNGVPPSITGLGATGILNGVLLTWNTLGILPNAYYKVYVNTVNNSATATALGTTTTAGYLYQVKNKDFSIRYFWVVVVNSGGIEGVKGSAVSATPLMVDNGFLDTTLTLAAGKIILAGTVTLASWKSEGVTTIDGGQITAHTVTADALVAGTLAIGSFDAATQELINNGDAAKTLTDLWKQGNTTYINGGQIYTGTINAASLNIVGIDSATGKLDPTQLKTKITGDEISTGTITAANINGKTITANEIALGTITNNELSPSVTIAASQIVLQGEVSLIAWEGSTPTVINGNVIETGTIKGNSIDPANPITSDRILSIDASKVLISGSTYFSSLFHTGTTLIDGGAIYTNTLVVGYSNLASDVTTPITNAQSTANAANTLAGQANTAAGNAATAASNAQSTANTANTNAGVANANATSAYNSAVAAANAASAAQTTANSAWNKVSDAGAGVTLGGVSSTANAASINATAAKTAIDVAFYESSGTTYINGGYIYTGAIQCTQLQAGTLGAGVIYAGEIAANKITAGSLDVDVLLTSKINVNQLNAGTLAADIIYGGYIAANKISAGTMASNVKGAYVETGDTNSARTVISASGSGCVGCSFTFYATASLSSPSGAIFMESGGLKISAGTTNFTGNVNTQGGTLYSGTVSAGAITASSVYSSGSIGTGAYLYGVRLDVSGGNGGSLSDYTIRAGTLISQGATITSLSGSSGQRAVYIDSSSGQGTLCVASSSVRFKTNIEPLEKTLDTSFIYKINPISFNYKNRADDKVKNIGFLAEDVAEYSEELVWRDETNQVEGIHYEWLVVPVIAEMKKLKNEIETLKAELASIKKPKKGKA